MGLVINGNVVALSTLSAQINTIDDYVDTEVASILAAVDTEVASILSDTTLRSINTGLKNIGAGATKYLVFDSGINGAEIVGITIKGVVGAAWTLDVYVPSLDAVADTAAIDKRDSIVYLATDVVGGLLNGFSVPFNAFLDFTNNAVGAADITDIVVLYRSRAAASITWEV